MSRINQAGVPVEESNINWPDEFQEGELAQAVLLLCAHLNLYLVRTNATKHGNTELQLKAES